MLSIEGIVTVAQESRFRLVTPDGRSHLFLLSPSNALEAQDLPPLAERQASVRVAYEPGGNGLLAAIAHSLETIPRVGQRS